MPGVTAGLVFSSGEFEPRKPEVVFTQNVDGQDISTRLVPDAFHAGEDIDADDFEPFIDTSEAPSKAIYNLSCWTMDAVGAELPTIDEVFGSFDGHQGFTVERLYPRRK